MVDATFELTNAGDAAPPVWGGTIHEAQGRVSGRSSRGPDLFGEWHSILLRVQTHMILEGVVGAPRGGSLNFAGRSGGSSPGGINSLRQFVVAVEPMGNG